MRRLSLGLLFYIISTQTSVAKTIKNGLTEVVAVGEISSEVLTVSESGVVFEQNVQPKEVVSLPEGSDILVRKTGDSHVRLEKDSKLYLVKNKKGEGAYCSYGPAYFVTPKLGKPFELQACLQDTDEIGIFDVLFLSEKGQLDFPPIVHNRLRKMKTVFSPVSYVPSQSDDTLSQPMRVTLSKIKNKSVNFDIEALTADGEWVRHGQIEKSLASFPQTVDVFGAKFELQSRTSDTLTLKLLSGFSHQKIFKFSGKRINSKKDLDLLNLE